MVDRNRVRHQVAYDFQQFQILVQLNSRYNLAVDSKRRDHFFVLNDRNAQERNRIAVELMASGSAQEAFVFGDVRHQAGNSRCGNMPRDAFPEFVSAAFLFVFIKPLRSFYDEDISLAQGESAAHHSHFPVQDIKHFSQQSADIAFMDDSGTDFLQNCDFRLQLIRHNVSRLATGVRTAGTCRAVPQELSPPP